MRLDLATSVQLFWKWILRRQVPVPQGLARSLLLLSAIWASELLNARISAQAPASPWVRHTIDSSFRGADGVRLADFNGDGRSDVVTGWEESGVIRLYLNPGDDRTKSVWPAVTVGNGASPEDAVPIDLDGDGRLEIVSCHEGGFKRVLVHTQVGSELLDEESWRTQRVAALDGQRWMFATEVALVCGRRAVAFGSKTGDASITLFTSPIKGSASKLSDWHVTRIRDAGWIMSLRSIDMDGDGDQDLLYSDRKGPNRGVGWLEQPDENSPDVEWKDHSIGAAGMEPMFLDGDRNRILLSTRNSVWLDFRRQGDGNWQSISHPNPAGLPNGKAIARLGDRGIVQTFNSDVSKKIAKRVGVWYASDAKQWVPISRTESVKLDRIECLDLDGDGDLDVLTCEERKNQGVIWYENPSQ